jgi:DNA-binding NarL/FixJ family response regulator
MSTPSPVIELPENSINALVLDAHLPTRIGLGVLLRRQPWVARCLLAAQQEESVVLAREHRPDVAIVDVSNAGPFAAAITGPLLEAHPALEIVLSSRCSATPSAPLASVGAVAFLTPGSTGEQIIETIRAALLSQATPEARPSQPPRPGLTIREQDVLLLLSTGATNHEIAAQLHLSHESIKKHATALYRKLGVRNRTEAAQRAASLLGAA